MNGVRSQCLASLGVVMAIKKSGHVDGSGGCILHVSRWPLSLQWLVVIIDQLLSRSSCPQEHLFFTVNVHIWPVLLPLWELASVTKRYA